MLGYSIALPCCRICKKTHLCRDGGGGMSSAVLLVTSLQSRLVHAALSIPRHMGSRCRLIALVLYGSVLTVCSDGGGGMSLCCCPAQPTLHYPILHSQCNASMLTFFYYRDGGGGMSSAVRRPERAVLEQCISAVASALGIIMAGSGDLDCFRVLRELRYNSSIDYNMIESCA